MAEAGSIPDPGGSTDTPGVQELSVGDSTTLVRAFVMLVEIIGGVVEFPFDKLTDPNELRDRTIYVEYDDNSRLVRYTVKHHDVITGELVAPEGA